MPAAGWHLKASVVGKTTNTRQHKNTTKRNTHPGERGARQARSKGKAGETKRNEAGAARCADHGDDEHTSVAYHGEDDSPPARTLNSQHTAAPRDIRCGTTASCELSVRAS